MPLFKLFATILNIPRIIPSFILFCLKINDCEDDVKQALVHRHFNSNVFIGFCYLMVFDKTFRNIFYKRIGKLKYFVYYFMPPHDSFVIATYMDCGKGFLGIHPIATFVNADKVGENFTVRNNVTIGASKTGRPTIGNNVIVNANSLIAGKVNIGNNVVVGGGTIVMKDILDNCVVVGNPAYILYQNDVRVNKPL